MARGPNYQSTDVAGGQTQQTTPEGTSATFTDAYALSSVNRSGASPQNANLEAPIAAGAAEPKNLPGHEQFQQLHHGKGRGVLPFLGSALAGAGAYAAGQFAWNRWYHPANPLEPGSVIRASTIESNRYVQFVGTDGEFRSAYMPYAGNESYSALHYDFQFPGLESHSTFFVGVGPETEGNVLIHNSFGGWARVGQNGDLLDGDPNVASEAFSKMTGGLVGSEHLISPQMAKALDLLSVFADAPK